MVIKHFMLILLSKMRRNNVLIKRNPFKNSLKINNNKKDGSFKRKNH